MKRIETTGINHHLHLVYKGWLLETDADVLEYIAMIDPIFRNGITALLKTKIEPDRWDHLARNDAFGSLLTYSIAKSSMSGGSVLLNIGTAFDNKINLFNKYILLGKKIIVNDVGGFCFLEDTYNVVESYRKKIEYYIGSGKYINLENDPILEDYTCTHIPNCSYILNTFSLEESELKKILKEFKDKGGVGIWQYTTGYDVDQLYTFMRVGLNVGLTEFIFHFNSGINEDLEKFINDYKDYDGIKFEYKEVNKK